MRGSIKVQVGSKTVQITKVDTDDCLPEITGLWHYETLVAVRVGAFKVIPPDSDDVLHIASRYYYQQDGVAGSVTTSRKINEFFKDWNHDRARAEKVEDEYELMGWFMGGYVKDHPGAAYCR